MDKTEQARHLRDVEGLSWIDVAERMGLTEGTARYHYHKEAEEPRGPSLVQTGNRAVVDSSLRPVPQSLDDLLEMFGTDLDKWRVDRHKLNFWGNEEDFNTQVKAWMSLLKPEPLRPTIGIIEAAGFKPPIVSTRQSGENATLALFDPHFGFKRRRSGELVSFHDRRALGIALRVANELQPGRIVIGGDILDNAEWTQKFSRAPEYYFTTMPALIEAHLWLRWFSEIAPVTIIEGNHDIRIQHMVVDNILAAAGLSPADDVAGLDMLSIERLLGLAGLGIEYLAGYPDAEVWLNDELRIEHGARAIGKAGKTASAMVQEIPKSTLFGHIHRKEIAIRTIHTRDRSRVLEAICPGALCKVDGTVPGHTGKQQWSQGFAVAHHNYDGNYDVETIDVRDGKAWLGGQLIKSEHDGGAIDRYVDEQLKQRR